MITLNGSLCMTVGWETNHVANRDELRAHRQDKRHGKISTQSRSHAKRMSETNGRMFEGCLLVTQRSKVLGKGILDLVVDPGLEMTEDSLELGERDRGLIGGCGGRGRRRGRRRSVDT